MVQHHLLATHPVGRPILSGGATGPEGSIFVVAIYSRLQENSQVYLQCCPRKRNTSSAHTEKRSYVGVIRVRSLEMT